ncbi:sigma-E factor negative regulatory protein [Methylobacter sp. YRD-M1]|uniref:sigma-E factor negative regulatory protein n=1 Tax=Methylobacter sp. YRD-M1 TaxID=2911520 RepID=UPI00227A9C6C|nr:sigma-E factor negative regulatory protein [Methylobacter sp. YRD-M1]WAK02911.1 sigma-E factor negative regulatory protein [Methylobacter sp. YRD-M1]
MHEDLNQKISQFLDNELSADESLSLLQKIQQNAELRDKMNRYAAVSHALKTDTFISPRSDFLERISQEIQHEPVYMLPQHNKFKRSHKFSALAASIAVVAVIASQSMKYQTEQYQTAPIEVTQSQLPEQSSDSIVYRDQTRHYPVNTRFNDYLQAHNSSVYTNGEVNFQSFASVTVYNQE